MTTMKAVRNLIYNKALQFLPRRYKQRLLIDLARDLEISKIRIRGEYGEVSGLIDDAAIFRSYLLNGLWSKNINDIFIKFFSKTQSGTYFDIGANIGLTTIAIAQNSNIECHAFEPEPVNFELLSENVKHNISGQNVTLHNLAVFSEPMQLTFELAEDNYADHRVRYGKPKESSRHFREGERKTIVVPGDKLTNLVRGSELKRPLAAKIDTEGCEYHVYKGGREILREAELMVLEYWPYAVKRMEGDLDELISMLQEDFPYGALLRDNLRFNPAGLVKFSDLVETLQSLAQQSEEMGWIDLVLTKKRV
jgi:FkbM family methyltransferase